MLRKILLFASLLIISLFSQAQTNTWQPAQVNVVDGTNSYGSIEVWYSLSGCSGTPTVLLKLVNDNSYPVKVWWKNAVITNDKKSHAGPGEKITLVLKPKSETIGSCNGSIAELQLKLSDFGTDPKNFLRFYTADFGYEEAH